MPGSYTPYDWSTNDVITADRLDNLETQFAQAITDAVQVLDRDVIVHDVTNTTTETTVYSKTVVANTLSTNRSLRLTLDGDWLSSVTARTTTVRVKFGGVVVAEITINFAADANRRAVRIVSTITAKNATTDQAAVTTASVGGAAAAGIAMANGLTATAIHSAVGRVTTADQDLVVTAEHSNAETTLSFRAQIVVLELLR